METRTQCPICDSSNQVPFLNTMDYSVSREEFTIVQCTDCGFHFTNPVPDANVIGNYYKSTDYVSHSSSKKGLINRVYHYVRWYSLRKKRKLINSLTSGRNLLDVGSGTGHFLNVAKHGGWNVVGLEPDSDARSFAKANFELELRPIEDLYSLDPDYDVITMWHVLEHVYNLKSDVKKLTELLKPGGTLVVAVPNMNSYDAKYYKEYWAAYDLPIHLYHFQKQDIQRLFDHVDMELIKTLPMSFDSFYVSMLSEKYKEGNLLNGLLTGLKSNWLANDDSWSSQIYILRRKSH